MALKKYFYISACHCSSLMSFGESHTCPTSTPPCHFFLFSDGVWFDVWHILGARPNVCTPVTFRNASYFKTTGQTLILYVFEFLHYIVSCMCVSAWIGLYIWLIPFKGFLQNLSHISNEILMSPLLSKMLKR